VKNGGGSWRRGDFHLHTGHSDGTCPNIHGLKIPCPVQRTFEAAAAAGLDFIAITDHNTLSHAPFIKELQPAYPDLLVTAGMEVTTFFGHANAIGLNSPISFKAISSEQADLAGPLSQIEEQGGFLSINHPMQPSGEACMGCGWTLGSTPWGRISAIEVVNGGSLRIGGAEGPMSGIPFWEDRLNSGYRITAIAGSDNHDPTDLRGVRQSPVGTPTTYVWMASLSETDLLRGVKSGRVFIDLDPGTRKTLDMMVETTNNQAEMGGQIILAEHEWASAQATVEGIEDPVVEFISGGLSLTPGDSPLQAARFSLQPGAPSGWIRVNVRSATGRLLLIGNPVYIVANAARDRPAQ
jgi:hypothetical protein